MTEWVYAKRLQMTAKTDCLYCQHRQLSDGLKESHGSFKISCTSHKILLQCLLIRKNIKILLSFISVKSVIFVVVNPIFYVSTYAFRDEYVMKFGRFY